ncbi:MAG: T9SS type A sorting domain-containing protein [Bacteroidota bacterium]|nr:T9SS type A sorting domain-containing protein [Bacteroidota bacterium]
MKTKNLYSWKTLFLSHILWLIISILYIATPSSVSAQCGNSMATRTYDTLVKGIGYGSYAVSFPKWSPDSGTLMSVKLNTSVSLSYGFTLKNADVVPSTYTILVGRVEQISSPALSVPYSNTVEQSLGAYSLVPGAQVVKPPFSLMGNYNNTDSISGAVASFVGSGMLNFDYEPITYTDIHTNNNSSYAYSATAHDTVHFSLTYTYCKAGLLAAALTHWTAELQDPRSVLLSWGAVNEQPGRVYEIEESRDGQHFDAAGSFAASGAAGGGSSVAAAEQDYSFVADLGSAPSAAMATATPSASRGIAGKWYFRLKWTDPGMNPVYSIIRMVEMASAGRGISIYPNPANDHINILFDAPNAAGADGVTSRQVDILAADGRLIQRQILAAGASVVRIDFRGRLAPGVYFVRAMQLQQGGSPMTASFLVK